MSAPVTAEAAHAILEAHPAFKRACAQFCALHDAAAILDTLKPPHGDVAAEYLREVGNTVLRGTGIGEDFVQAMIAARPPSPGETSSDEG